MTAAYAAYAAYTAYAWRCRRSVTEPYTAVQCAEWAESGDRMSEPISASWSADAAYFCSGEEEFMPF